MPALKRGLIVEQVITNSQAQRAGVQPSDVLLGWKRGSIYGDFQSPFGLAYIFLEQAPRGPWAFSMTSKEIWEGRKRIIARLFQWQNTWIPTAWTLLNILADLAEFMAEQENPAAAEIFQNRALSIREKPNPGGLPGAYSLAGLGKITNIFNMNS